MHADSQRRTFAYAAAELIVKRPWQVVLLFSIPVLLSLIVVPFVPLYVDTGANAIFARKTTISNRINSGDIIRQILPKKPNNVMSGFEDAVQRLVANHSAAGEGSDAVFGDVNHFSEVHVLVHALNGDVLDPDTMEQACAYMHHVFAEQSRTGVCLPVGTVWSIDTATRNLADNTSNSSPGEPGAPLPRSSRRLSQAAAPSAVPSGSRSSSQPPAPTADVKLDLEFDLSADSPLSAALDEAFAPGPGPADFLQSKYVDCIPPFSIFNVRETLRHLGYGPQLLLIDTLAPMVTQSAIEKFSVVCSMPTTVRSSLLCSSLLPCDPFSCSPSSAATNSSATNSAHAGINGMLGGGSANGPQCLISGIDPCDILNDINPTAEEILKVMAIPDTPLDSQGCESIDFDGLDTTIEAFWVLRNWSQRSPSVAGASRLVDALLSADFGSAPDFSKESTVTRIVFGVPRLLYEAETALGEYAARAATEYRTSTVAFIWRQWAFFDVYANRSLMRDLTFSLGSLLFLFVYALTQIGSLLLTVAVICSILCTLPLALAAYSVLLGVRWVGVLHFLGVFVILGIGADDVFVVLEHWKHSADHACSKIPNQPPTVVDRMAWCIEHSGMSVSATSATTIAAFAANMTSSITPVRLFGLFMVILVTMNLVFVVIMLLAFLAIRENSSRRRDSTRAARAAVAAATNARGTASINGHSRRRQLGISVANSAEMVPLNSTPRGVAAANANSPNASIAAVQGSASHQPRPHEPYPMSLALTHPSEKGMDPSMRTLSLQPCTEASEEETFLLARPVASMPSLEGSSTGLSPFGSPRNTHGSGAHFSGLHSPAALAPSHEGELSRSGSSPSQSGNSTPQPMPRRTDGSWVPSLIASGDYSHSGTIGRPRGFLRNAMAFTCSLDPDTKDITCVAPTSGTTPSTVHEFLGGQYARWLYSWRHFVLLVTLIVVCFSAWRASLLELPHSRPTVWRKGSNMHSYYDLELDFAFGRILERIPVTLAWGYKPIDNGSLNKVYQHTDAVLDPAANFTSPEAQQWLLSLCVGLDGWSQKPDSPIVINSVQCPLPLVHEIAAVRNISFPMPSEVFKQQLRTYSELTAAEPDFARVLWGTPTMSPQSPANPLRDGFIASADTFHVHPDLNPATYGGDDYWLDPASTKPRRWTVTGTAGGISSSMWYRVDIMHGNFSEPLVMQVEFTLKETWAQSFQHTKHVWETWEAWMHQQLESAPEGLKTGFQTGDRYSIMEEQAVMFRSGQVSLALSLALALLALVAVSGNVVLALLATVCMVAVITIFLGAVELMGWTLGIVECVGIAIMVGLEVDYIVHVATCIGHSPENGRAGVDYALRTMGMSVVSGYTTTVGAALFLLPCEMGVFEQFGIMVVVTLTTALVFALVVFPALCYCVNIHNTDIGSLSVLFQGRWGDFWGHRRRGSSARGERHGSYVRVNDNNPEILNQVIELTGLEALDSMTHDAVEADMHVHAPVVGPLRVPSTGAPLQEATREDAIHSTEPGSLEPGGLWTGGWQRRSGEQAGPADRKYSKGGDQDSEFQGSTAAMPLVAAAEIFRIESAQLHSDGRPSNSSWGSQGGWNSGSRGPYTSSAHFREWEMSGIASASGSALRSSVMRSAVAESQSEIESLGEARLPPLTAWAAKRVSGGSGTGSPGAKVVSVAASALADTKLPSPEATSPQPRRSNGAEVGVHAIGGSTEGLVLDGKSQEGPRMQAGVDAVGGSMASSRAGSGSSSSVS